MNLMQRCVFVLFVVRVFSLRPGIETAAKVQHITTQPYSIAFNPRNSCQEAPIYAFPNDLNVQAWNSKFLLPGTGVNESAELPICDLRNGRPIRVRCVYDKSQNKAVWESINYSRNAACWRLHCEMEAFSHDYLMPNNRTVLKINTWQRARIGEYATLQDVCLRENGVPVARRCLARNGRAVWEDISSWPHVQCRRQLDNSSINGDLHDLHEQILNGTLDINKARSRWQISDRVHSMLRQSTQRVLPATVHATAQIMQQLAAEVVDGDATPNVVGICSELMTSEPDVLRLSAQVNATNTLLSSFESYIGELPAQLVPLERCVHGQTPTFAAANEVKSANWSHIGVQAHFTRNLSVFLMNPSCANVTGVALYNAYSDGRVATEQGYWYRFVYMHESIAELKRNEQLEVASFLPTSLWSKVRAALTTQGKAAYLVYTIYAKDTLFVETSELQHRKPFSHVLSISIPGLNSTLPEPLIFLLRNHQLNDRHSKYNATVAGTGCGYWNYTAATWLSDGVQTYNGMLPMAAEPVISCSTMHLTQFSYLLGGNYRQNDPGAEALAHERLLDIISLVGCCLSLLGLLGIWLTAIVLRNWRKIASTKVLLNMCVALTLQMILFVFVNTDDISEQLVHEKAYWRCVALGASLQYSVLVLFTWMLIVAVLQFQRYVTVIGIARPRHYILKSALIAWGFPLLPTLLVAGLDSKSYIPTHYQLTTDTGICYPSGLGLHFGVVLPVSLICVANLIIFVYVFYSISQSLGQAMQRTEKQLVIKQIRLSVLLFFLLGLSWIFGILAFMHISIVFSYLFCLTATIQGLVLFIFFIIIDEVPRNEWQRLLCPAKAAKKRQRELQSITSSTNDHNGL